MTSQKENVANSGSINNSQNMASITTQDTLTVLVTKHLILHWFQINLILQLVVNKNNPVLVATDTVCGASCHGLGA